MHIVMVPMPLQGHVNPCLAIARLLIPQGFTFTVVLTEDLAGKLSTVEGGEKASASSSIQYAAIPLERPAASGAMSNIRMVDRMRPAFETLLRKLVSSSSSSSPRVSFIIADSFLPWALPVASDFDIPAFLFFTPNAHTLTTVLHAQTLISLGIAPVEDPDGMVNCIPGLPPMRAGDLPDPVRTHPSLLVDRFKNVQKAAGVIINTVYELEREPLEAIKSKVRTYAIGPMLGESGKPEGEEIISLWTAERECLHWLDTRPASSVLFIAFGSLASMNDDQVKELAEGIEASGHAFLWVIRSNAIQTPLSTLLPEGFTERTRDRGLIISWAPQLEVLSHRAVGGFITHCGWNSINENLLLGAVPMICWPQVAEQRLNKMLLVNKWKVGLELQEEDGVVKRGEVEKVVKQLMQGEEGRELKKRVLELKEIISRAVQDGGSTQNHLKALGQDIKKLGLAP